MTACILVLDETQRRRDAETQRRGDAETRRRRDGGLVATIRGMVAWRSLLVCMLFGLPLASSPAAATRTLVVANNHFHGKAMTVVEDLLAYGGKETCALEDGDGEVEAWGELAVVLAQALDELEVARANDADAG